MISHSSTIELTLSSPGGKHRRGNPYFQMPMHAEAGKRVVFKELASLANRRRIICVLVTGGVISQHTF